MSITHTIDLSADIIDVRDIIARVEELEPDVADIGEGEHIAEWKALTSVLANLQGMGGDKKWRERWYPLTLIRDSHFRDYSAVDIEGSTYWTR